MARFRGTIQGARGPSSRLGHDHLRVEAQSWQGKVVVELSKKSDNDVDWANVFMTTHNGAGASPTRYLYAGPVDGTGEAFPTKSNLARTLMRASVALKHALPSFGNQGEITSLIEELEAAQRGIERAAKAEYGSERLCPHGYPSTVRCTRCGE